MKTRMIPMVAVLCLALASPALASKKLFVGGLSWGTTADQVHRVASLYGPVLSVIVVGTDRDGDKSAKATVVFEYPEDAETAAVELDGAIIRGRHVSAKTREIVVVGSKVKEVIREAGLRSDGDLVQAVSDKVYELLQAAIDRCKGNHRSTVRPYDL